MKFEIEDIKGWKRVAAFWGVIGLIGSISYGVTVSSIALAIVIGGATGALSALCLTKEKPRLITPINYAGIAILIFILWIQNAFLSPLASLSLGALFLSLKSVTYGILGEFYVQRMNDKYKEVLAALTPEPERVGPPSAPIDTKKAREIFLAALPEPLRENFTQSVCPVTSIHPFRSLESLAPTHSAFGGQPLLPNGEPWPLRDGKPLEFLAQIDLSQVPPTAHSITYSGLLLFFYDTENQDWGDDAGSLGSARVIHCPDPRNCQPAMKPGTVPPPPLRLPVSFLQSVDLCLSDEQEDTFYSYFRSLPEHEKDRLNDIHEALLESETAFNRILSAPARIQGDMDSDLAAASSAYNLPADTSWIPLLQLDSVNELNWCWGDAGCLYFHIPLEDLANQRFDRPWVVLQCH